MFAVERPEHLVEHQQPDRPARQEVDLLADGDPQGEVGQVGLRPRMPIERMTGAADPQLEGVAVDFEAVEAPVGELPEQRGRLRGQGWAHLTHEAVAELTEEFGEAAQMAGVRLPAGEFEPRRATSAPRQRPPLGQPLRQAAFVKPGVRQGGPGLLDRRSCRRPVGTGPGMGGGLEPERLSLGEQSGRLLAGFRHRGFLGGHRFRQRRPGLQPLLEAKGCIPRRFGVGQPLLQRFRISGPVGIAITHGRFGLVPGGPGGSDLGEQGGAALVLPTGPANGGRGRLFLLLGGGVLRAGRLQLGGGHFDGGPASWRAASR